VKKRKFPYVAVDALIIVNKNKLILIKRLKEPFKNFWALPGGFVEYGETVEQAIVREVKEETGLIIEPTSLIGVYSDPRRDPRGHVISIAFLVKVKGGRILPSTNAKEVQIFDLEKLPSKLAFDHKRIIEDGIKLARKLGILD